MISPSSSSKISGDISWKIDFNDPIDLHRGFKIAVQTPFGIASKNFSEDFLAVSSLSKKFKNSCPGHIDWMSNQPIKPETPSPVPSPPTSGPRCQYTLADFNIELWNLHDLDRQAKFHPLPPFSNFPGTGGEKSPVGEGPKGETGPKQPKSRPEDVETLDYLLDIKESVRVIAREHVQQGFQISDILRAIESTHKRMDEYEQKQLYLEKKTVNPLHDLKLGQQTILAKLKALPEPFNDSDAYYVPEPVPQHPFRQVEGGSSVKDFSHLNTAAPNGSDEGEIVPVEMGRPRPTPGLPTIPTPRPKPDHEPKRRPVPQPWVQ